MLPHFRDSVNCVVIVFFVLFYKKVYNSVDKYETVLCYF